jgi:hypothetical protein
MECLPNLLSEDEMKYETALLTIQDVIEILTNIKLKHGNLPVYVFDMYGDTHQTDQTELAGVQYKEEYKIGNNVYLPERVQII